MIAFETLFLGLVVGLQPVRVAVGPEVAAVELRLDGAAIATLTGAPWESRCDFGPAPHPHELVAVARDGDGGELARASQWINLPRPEAEAHLFLERDPTTRAVTSARLNWENLETPEPRRVRITLDGTPIHVANPRSFLLPTHDPAQVHVLTAELTYSDHLTARADAVFGGELGEQAETRLTAVPLLLDEGAGPPSLAALQGAFTVYGRPVRVAAIEDPPATVVMVADLRVDDLLRNPRLRMKTDAAGHLLAINPAYPDNDRLFATFGVSDTVDRGADLLRLFPISFPFELNLGNLEVVLGRLRFPGASPKSQLLGNAVAVAGVKAAADNRPRAVVLLLGGKGCEVGSVTPEAARAFLADLHVPLVVWSVAGAAGDTCWGPAAAADWPRGLYTAFPRLRSLLDRQRIVWLEGGHLPQRVQLAADRGFKLAQ